MTPFNKITELVDQVKDKCIEWVLNSEKGLFFVDPIEGNEISAHYGAVCAAVGLLILGIEWKNRELEQKGKSLLESVVARWESNSRLQEFHNDFNNFTLCVAVEHLQHIPEYLTLSKKIKRTVLGTSDSNHDTINWLPMRWYVNKCRHEWTGNVRYNQKCQECANKIKRATYNDGFIDDLLPKGTSFNLQYDIATVAGLQFLSKRGENIDISKEIGALLYAVAPDGDINYFGRGLNQIFAWGLWIYLLASTGLETELKKALNYCGEKILVMLEKNNIMLNDWEGNEQYLWWDYHYCSVYIAHLLFWLSLAIEDYSNKQIKIKYPDEHDSGIEIFRQNGWFVMTFSGRSEYLAESGPVIGAIGIDTGEMIIKGSFGPWFGKFGENNTYPNVVLQNFLGLLTFNNNGKCWPNVIWDIPICLYLRKLFVKTQPVLCPISISTDKESITIQWKSDKTAKCLNIPVFSSNLDVKLLLSVDGVERRVLETSMIRNQYKWVRVFSSQVLKGQNWKLVMFLRINV